MKKIFILVLFICLFLGISNVSAATIESTKYENSKLSISGAGEKQVQIVIFNSELEPIFMTTAAVTDSKYEITLPIIASLVDGEYTLKVANYDGTETASKKLTISSTVDNTKGKNPNTSDSIMFYVIISILGVVGIFGSIIYLKKNLV